MSQYFGIVIDLVHVLALNANSYSSPGFGRISQGSKVEHSPYIHNCNQYTPPSKRGEGRTYNSLLLEAQQKKREKRTTLDHPNVLFLSWALERIWPEYLETLAAVERSSAARVARV